MEDTHRAWRAMERFVPHKVRSIGISNVDLHTLQELHARSSIVQNRLTQDISSATPPPGMPPGLPYPNTPYDQDVRGWCAENEMIYQPWGLLWGSPRLLAASAVHEAARDIETTPEVALYLLIEALNVGNVQILCGTRSLERMQETMDGYKKFQEWVAVNHEKWEIYVNAIREIVDN